MRGCQKKRVTGSKKSCKKNKDARISEKSCNHGLQAAVARRLREKAAKARVSGVRKNSGSAENRPVYLQRNRENRTVHRQEFRKTGGYRQGIQKRHAGREAGNCSQ